MSDRQIKQPGPDHQIMIEANEARVVVSVAGRVIADTKRALTLREANHASVQYIPRADVDMSFLEATDHRTYCPYKGACNYYSIPSGEAKSLNAAWTYQAPFETVAEIKGYIAFYPARVDAIEEKPAA